MLSILETVREPALFSRWFKDPTTWAAWCVFLAALFGLPLEPAQSEVFRQCTGRTAPLAAGHVEAWLTVGRRGGKSIILALIAVYLAVFRSWSDRLVPGERGTVLVIAADRRQARVIFRYITALITETSLIAPLVDGEATQDRIDLTNGISIEISTANFRSVRGYTLIACLCDEIAGSMKPWSAISMPTRQAGWSEPVLKIFARWCRLPFSPAAVTLSSLASNALTSIATVEHWSFGLPRVGFATWC